jgi:lipopolysaccharide transport system permease protein
MSLVRRQLHIRYRQSLMGFGWAILPPLAMMGMATLVFDRIANVDTGSAPYPLFALAALAPWTFFANGVTAGTPSVVQSTAMLIRIPFPRITLPLSMLGTSLVDLAIASGVFLVVLYAAGYSLPATAVWFPILVIIEAILTAGVVLLVSALNVFARDVRLAIPIAIQLWLFLTPVMYPLDSVPESLHPFYLANPMTGLIESFRAVLLPPGAPPNPELLVPSIVGAVLFLFTGWFYFRSTQVRFADVV